MAHAPSAKKRHRQSLKRHDRNQGRRTEARSAVRSAREAIAAGKEEEATAAVRRASTILDRAAAKGVLHRNNADRRKARLVGRLRKLGEPASETKPRRTRAKKS